MDVKAQLTKKIGPLPTYAWALILIGGFLIAKKLRGDGDSNEAATEDTESVYSGIPSYSGAGAGNQVPGGVEDTRSDSIAIELIAGLRDELQDQRELYDERDKATRELFTERDENLEDKLDDLRDASVASKQTPVGKKPAPKKPKPKPKVKAKPKPKKPKPKSKGRSTAPHTKPPKEGAQPRTPPGRRQTKPVRPKPVPKPLAPKPKPKPTPKPVNVRPIAQRPVPRFGAPFIPKPAPRPKPKPKPQPKPIRRSGH